MATQTVEQVQRLAPYLEGLEKRLLQSAFGEFDGDEQTSKGLLDTALNLPQFQVAGLDPLQQQALAAAPQMFGSFAPALRTALGQTGASQLALGAGLGSLMDPATSMARFFNPFETQVVDQTLADIARAGDIQRQGIGSQASKGGAFGGSRFAVAEMELNRNLGDQMARTGAQLRSAGFQQAQQQAQSAFQNQMARQQSAAQLFGQLGQGIGTLGSALGKAGLAQAALGESAQRAQQADINTLLSLGGIEQQQAQAQIDAQRATDLERQMEPYQRISFLSDIFRGVPSTQTTLTAETAPSPSTFERVLGGGLGLAGLGQSLNITDLLGLGG